VKVPRKQRAAASGSRLAAVDALRDLVIDSLENAKAVDAAVISLAGKSSIADYMIIASGTSSRHVSAVADQLGRRLRENAVKGVTMEGELQGDWVLIDAGDIIIHLFRPEVREFYGLEKMWGPAGPGGA